VGGIGKPCRVARAVPKAFESVACVGAGLDLNESAAVILSHTYDPPASWRRFACAQLEGDRPCAEPPVQKQPNTGPRRGKDAEPRSGAALRRVRTSLGKFRRELKQGGCLCFALRYAFQQVR